MIEIQGIEQKIQWSKCNAKWNVCSYINTENNFMAKALLKTKSEFHDTEEINWKMCILKFYAINKYSKYIWSYHSKKCQKWIISEVKTNELGYELGKYELGKYEQHDSYTFPN